MYLKKKQTMDDKGDDSLTCMYMPGVAEEPGGAACTTNKR